jgi:hypothetical protein
VVNFNGISNCAEIASEPQKLFPSFQREQMTFKCNHPVVRGEALRKAYFADRKNPSFGVSLLMPNEVAGEEKHDN